MEMSEILQRIAFETQKLQSHFESGELDRRYIEEQSDELVSYALLLRDLAGARANRSTEIWRSVEAQLASADH